MVLDRKCVCSSPHDSVHVCVYCVYQYTRLTGLSSDVNYFISVLCREVTTGRGSPCAEMYIPPEER